MPNPLDALFPSNDRTAPGATTAPPSPGDMVTVARRFHPIEAEVLRGRLEADGIPAVLGDSHTVQTDVLLTSAMGGVRILVPAEFERQALRAIADIERGAFALDEGTDVATVDDDVAEAGAAGGFSRSAVVGIGAVVFVAVLVGLFH